MRIRVWSLASFSVSSISMSCGVGHRGSSDPTLLWLWCKPSTIVPIWPLTWESPYAMGPALKKQKTKKEKRKGCDITPYITLTSQAEICQVATPSCHSSQTPFCPGPTWNQIAFTTLLSTNRGSTQRALKIDVRKNSSQDQTSPCSDGSPKKGGKGY